MGDLDHFFFLKETDQSRVDLVKDIRDDGCDLCVGFYLMGWWRFFLTKGTCGHWQGENDAEKPRYFGYQVGPIKLTRLTSMANFYAHQRATALAGPWKFLQTCF